MTHYHTCGQEAELVTRTTGPSTYDEVTYCPIHGEVPSAELLTAEAMVERLQGERDEARAAARTMFDPETHALDAPIWLAKYPWLKGE